MTALDHPTHAIGAASRTVIAVARLVENFGMLVRSLKNRRQLRHLAHMSDYELADIGLVRTDIEIARNCGYGVDPTSRLSRFARERHAIEESARRVC